MLITTVDGKKYNVKYLKNKESLTNKFGTAIHQYPNFIGSKLNQNSTSSDIYSLTFAIHKTLFIGFKESMKKFVIKEEDAIEDETYGKLLNIVIEHAEYGAIKGKFIGDIKYNTSSEADIICTATFQEHTPDEPLEKKDLEQENTDAESAVDTETDVGELDEADKPALLRLAENLAELYENIQNSAVIAAFNDLNSALNDAILNYQKVMNAVKKILSLPGSIITNLRGRLDFFKKQAAVIKRIPASTFNLARFNMNCLSFNLIRANRIPFFNKALLRKISGIKVAPIK